MCSSRLCDLAIKIVYIMQTEYTLERNLFAKFAKESQTFQSLIVMMGMAPKMYVRDLHRNKCFFKGPILKSYSDQFCTIHYSKTPMEKSCLGLCLRPSVKTPHFQVKPMLCCRGTNTRQPQCSLRRWNKNLAGGGVVNMRGITTPCDTTRGCFPELSISEHIF